MLECVRWVSRQRQFSTSTSCTFLRDTGADRAAHGWRRSNGTGRSQRMPRANVIPLIVSFGCTALPTEEGLMPRNIRAASVLTAVVILVVVVEGISTVALAQGGNRPLISAFSPTAGPFGTEVDLS